MSSRVEVVRAGLEHRRCLENLLELYIHDFSEFVPVDVGEDGRFGYADLPLYWSESHRRPFLARIEGKVAGFALVTRGPGLDGPNEVWDMAEFFVLRRYRHRGYGTEIAEAIWKLCPGRWQIRVRSNNLAARGFWESAIAQFLKAPVASQVIEVGGVLWNRFLFQSCEP